LGPARVSDATAAKAGVDTEDRGDPPGKGRLPDGGRPSKSSAGWARILERIYTNLKRRNDSGRLKDSEERPLQEKVRQFHAIYFSFSLIAFVVVASLTCLTFLKCLMVSCLMRIECLVCRSLSNGNSVLDLLKLPALHHNVLLLVVDACLNS
jgi:hypothetical protein